MARQAGAAREDDFKGKPGTATKLDGSTLAGRSTALARREQVIQAGFPGLNLIAAWQPL
jgi:hypothetical protein